MAVKLSYLYPAVSDHLAVGHLAVSYSAVGHLAVKFPYPYPAVSGHLAVGHSAVSYSAVNHMAVKYPYPYPAVSGHLAVGHLAVKFPYPCPGALGAHPEMKCFRLITFVIIIIIRTKQSELTVFVLWKVEEYCMFVILSQSVGYVLCDVCGVEPW